MDPRIPARARQRWNLVLVFSASATTCAVMAALWAAVVTASAAGADAVTLFVVAIAALLLVCLVIGVVLGISWWVLRRRDALGPSLLWGADRATRRRVARGLREGHELSGDDHELALSEATRTARFGLLLPVILFTNVGIQAGWLAVGWFTAGWAEAEENPLLFGTRLVAVAFFSWGGIQGLVVLHRARRYLARYGDATPEPATPAAARIPEVAE
jgi:hypothetical protein